jgi:hypothetical protein
VDKAITAAQALQVMRQQVAAVAQVRQEQMEY